MALVMPSNTVTAGGIWSGGPVQHSCWDPKTPCQLTLQPPSWPLIAASRRAVLAGVSGAPAFGPVTTTLLAVDSGSTLFWLRRSTIDSREAVRDRSCPEATMPFAFEA